MKTYYIYALINKKNKEIFYVGCTKNYNQRDDSHHRILHRKVTTTLSALEMYVRSNNIFPLMAILEKIVVAEDGNRSQPPIAAKEREDFWICKLLNRGCPLTNHVHAV